MNSASFNEVATRLLTEIAQELSAPEVVFPTSFDLTIRVQRMLKDPNVSIETLATFIRTEPLMSARIVTYANSASLRRSGPQILDVDAAILRVGLDAVRTVSYTLTVEQIIRSKHMMPFHELCTSIWEHSLVVATIARILAKRARMSPEKAFLLGIVHDMGAFYLLFRFAKDEVLSAHRKELVNLTFQWHDGIGHALLSAMGLPEDMLMAVQDHEAITDVVNFNNWSSLLSAADLLGQQLVQWGPEEEVQANPRAISNALLSEEEVSEILAQTKEELESVRVAFG